jgi:hypothetical protein
LLDFDVEDCFLGAIFECCCCYSLGSGVNWRVLMLSSEIGVMR